MAVALYSTAETFVASLAASVRSVEPVLDVTWTDVTALATTVSGSRVLTTGTTEVTIMAAPAANTTRTIKTIVCHNRDVVAAVLTLSMAEGTTRSVFATITLKPGQTAVVDSTGAITYPTVASALGSFAWVLG
jgi:hypothetical protein